MLLFIVNIYVYDLESQKNDLLIFNDSNLSKESIV